MTLLDDGVIEVTVGGRPVRALIDTAGTQLCFDQRLVDDLGLEVHERVDDGQGGVVAVFDPPDIAVGSTVLDTDGITAYGFDDPMPLGLTAHRAEVLVPATVLRRHHVVIDLAGGAFEIGPPSSFERRGAFVPAAIDPASGVVTTTIEVGGRPLDVVIDTAMRCCLVPDDTYRGWLARDADLPASAASVGPGNASGVPTESRIPMVRVPEVMWGEFTIPSVAFAWRPQGASGSLGRNALGIYRIDLDYAAGTVRVEQGRPFDEPDADQVGVVLAATDDDEWAVAATRTGLDDVRVGDVLVAVDGEPVTHLPLPAVLRTLAGEPGSTHHLALRRDDEVVEVTAPVTRLL